MGKDDNVVEFEDKEILMESDMSVDIPADVTSDVPSDEFVDELDGDADNTTDADDTIDTDVETKEEDNPKPKKKRTLLSGIKTFFSGVWKVIKTIFMGRILSIDFIIRYWKTIVTCLFVMLFYISNRYVCQQSAAHIKKLEREIVEIRYKSLDMFTRLKTLQREDSIVKYVDKYKLNLEFPKQPPYIIKAKADGEN